MKFIITHLKAPWPVGASIGSVVEFEGDAAPAWAVGKCVPAGEGAEVTHSFPEPGEPPQSVDPKEVAEAFHKLREEALARIAEAQRAFDAEKADLQTQLTDAAAALQVAQAEVASLRAELDKAHADATAALQGTKAKGGK